MSLAPLFRFHAASGARVASRNAILGLCTVVFAIGSAPEPLLLVRAIARGMAAADVAPTSLYVVTALAFVLAHEAVPRLTLGLGGWARSLPVEGGQHRRGVTLGLAIVHLPLALAVALGALITVVAYRDPLSAPKLLGAPVALLAAGAAAVPARRRLLALPLTLGAAGLAASGRWLGLGIALVLLAAADRAAGALQLQPRRSVGPAGADSRSSRMVRFTWRAIGWRALAPLPLPALALAAAWFYTRNNGLTGPDAAFIARLWGVLAVVLYTGAVADVIAARRPPWPWARSLPWSSRDRATDDTIALALPAIGIALAAAVVDPRAPFVTLAVLPPIATIGAGALPRARHHVTRATGRLVLAGIPLAIACAYAPWVAALVLLGTPLLVGLAARGDRRVVVTGWRELYHDAAGDTLSWSAR